MSKKRKRKSKKLPIRQRIRNYFFSRYLDEGENLLEVAHRHILIFKIAAGKAGFFGIIIPVIFYVIFPQALIISIIWIVIGLMAVFYHFVDWYFDAWILTNVGVVDVERNGFFDFTSTRVDYHMMEGISYNIKGVLATIFQFGDITIDKLGTATSVILKDASHPKRLERKVVNYQEKYLNSKSIQDHHTLKDMLSQMIAYHSQNGKV